jgi:hypothetical protein
LWGYIHPGLSPAITGSIRDRAMLIELDDFSGRPNPRWELDEQSAAALRAREARLTTSDVAPPESPGLGYRGFVYRTDDDVHRAALGWVRTPQRVLADPALTVERFLLQRLPPEHAAVATRVAAVLRSQSERDG